MFAAPKSSSSVTLMNTGPQPVTPNWNMDDYNEEGYKKNLVVFRSVNMIADACAEIPFLLFKKTRGAKTMPEEILNHEILNLLEKPNPSQSGSDFIKWIISHYLIQGNTYVRGIAPTGKPPRELWVLRPDQMSVIPGAYGLPRGYVQTINRDKKFYPSDPVNGKSEIMHWRTFSPNDDWLGMSAVEAASFSIDQQNTSNKWNLGLLNNSARPSGAFVVQSEGGSRLTPEQRGDLKSQITEQYSGAANTGKPILLEGGLTYQEMGLSPKDMEFLNNKNVTARDIALIFGVPPQLLGIPGDNTYSNYQEARLAFYQDTVLPMRKNLRRNLNAWLVKSFDESLYLEDDKDSIDALAPIREMEWSRAQTSTWLTINEKRELTRYGKYEETDSPADMLFVPSGQLPLSIAGDVSFTTEEHDSDTSDYEEEEEEEDETSEDGKQVLQSQVIFKSGKHFNITSHSARRAFQARQLRKRARHESRFRSHLKGVFQKEMIELTGAIQDTPKELIEFTVNGILDETRPYFETVIKNNLKSIMHSWGGEVLSIPKSMPNYIESKQSLRESRLDHYIEEYIRAKSIERATSISKTTSRKLKRILKKALAEDDGLTNIQIQKLITDAYKSFSPTRAYTIATTETHSASISASLRAAKETELPTMKKTWISDLTSTARGMNSSDSTNHVSMDGVSIPVDEKFVVPSKDGSDIMDGPGDSSAPADQVIHCKCVLTFNTSEGE